MNIQDQDSILTMMEEGRLADMTSDLKDVIKKMTEKERLEEMTRDLNAIVKDMSEKAHFEKLMNKIVEFHVCVHKMD